MADVWDENWFGSTKTLDVHMGWLRRKLGDDAADAALHPHGPRRRLPLRGAGRSERRKRLRTRLLLALAYVLLLAIVALEVPLALEPRATASTPRCARRRASQADVVAATAADLLAPRSATRSRRARRRAAARRCAGA